MDCFNGVSRNHTLSLSFHHITRFWTSPVVSAQLSHEFVCSSLPTCWWLNSNYCPKQRSFKFTVLSNTFTYVRYTEASNMWGITGPCSALRFNNCVHLRSISICISNSMCFSVLSDVIHSFIHSFCCLSYNTSIAYSTEWNLVLPLSVSTVLSFP